MRRGEWFQGVGHDVRQAARSLGRSPGFALATVLVLALGIGANTAIFSVVNGVLLKPLPYPRPGELVRIYESSAAVAGGEAREGSVSYPNLLDWREQSRSFESMVLLGGRSSLTLQGRGETERITAFSAGAPGILGSTLTLDGEPYTVVGIMPREFQYPGGGEAPDMWVPLPMGGPGFVHGSSIPAAPGFLRGLSSPRTSGSGRVNV